MMKRNSIVAVKRSLAVCFVEHVMATAFTVMAVGVIVGSAARSVAAETEARWVHELAQPLPIRQEWPFCGTGGWH